MLCVLYKCACLVSQVVVVFVCLSPACFPFVVFSLSVAANNNNNNNPLDPKAPGPFFRFDLAKNRRQMEHHYTHVRTHTNTRVVPTLMQQRSVGTLSLSLYVLCVCAHRLFRRGGLSISNFLIWSLRTQKRKDNPHKTPCTHTHKRCHTLPQPTEKKRKGGSFFKIF